MFQHRICKNGRSSANTSMTHEISSMLPWKGCAQLSQTPCMAWTYLTMISTWIKTDHYKGKDNGVLHVTDQQSTASVKDIRRQYLMKFICATLTAMCSNHVCTTSMTVISAVPVLLQPQKLSSMRRALMQNTANNACLTVNKQKLMMCLQSGVQQPVAVVLDTLRQHTTWQTSLSHLAVNPLRKYCSVTCLVLYCYPVLFLMFVSEQSVQSRRTSRTWFGSSRQLCQL